MPTTTQTITDADCCCDGEIPPCGATHLYDLWLAGPVTLNYSVTCAGADCPNCCADPPTCAFPCFPDSGMMVSSGFNPLDPDPQSPIFGPGIGLICDTGFVSLVCPGINSPPTPWGIQWSSSACAVTIPTTVVSYQDNPFILVLTLSSGWQAMCGTVDDGFGGYCGSPAPTVPAEATLTITISE